jgi:hypothetical protein
VRRFSKSDFVRLGVLLVHGRSVASVHFDLVESVQPVVRRLVEVGVLLAQDDIIVFKCGLPVELLPVSRFSLDRPEFRLGEEESIFVESFADRFRPSSRYLEGVANPPNQLGRVGSAAGAFEKEEYLPVGDFQHPLFSGNVCDQLSSLAVVPEYLHPRVGV